MHILGCDWYTEKLHFFLFLTLKKILPQYFINIKLNPKWKPLFTGPLMIIILNICSTTSVQTQTYFGVPNWISFNTKCLFFLYQIFIAIPVPNNSSKFPFFQLRNMTPL